MTRTEAPGLTERLAGSVIDHEPPTPCQQRWIESSRAALSSWLTIAGHGFRLEIAPQVRLDRSNLLAPTLAISAVASSSPDVVIELQFESTDRLILGAKRQLYGVLGVHDYLVVPSHRRSVLSMRRLPGRGTLAWPPILNRPGEEIDLSTAGLPPLPASALIGAPRASAAHEHGPRSSRAGTPFVTGSQ